MDSEGTSALDYRAVLTIIQKLNAFTDSADTTIQKVWASHESESRTLVGRYETNLRNLDRDQWQRQSAINAKARELLNEAESVRRDIFGLDATLANADRYFVRTKTKRQQALSDRISPRHADNPDFVRALKDIRERYRILADKYKDGLPAIINGINYALSAKRKQDYEELIVLLNTVESLIQEIKQTLPELTSDYRTELDFAYTEQRRHAAEQNSEAMADLSTRHSSDIDILAELICENLEEILPDSVLAELADLAATHYERYCKVPSGPAKYNGFILGFIDYPVDLYVSSPVLASLILDKCAPIVYEGRTLRFPLPFPFTRPINWLIKNDGTTDATLQQFTHSVMQEFLTHVPVTGMTYGIIDPENRGNSISPFFDIRKKMPAMFGEKVLVSQDEILDGLHDLNEYIDLTLQDRLGSSHETVFECVANQPDKEVPIQLLLVYDFPHGFDEQSLAALRNVLRNGYRCGVYVLICQDTVNVDPAFSGRIEAIRLVEEMCDVIRQNGDDLLMGGLPVSYTTLPPLPKLATFFNRYLLVYEGIKDKGVAFPNVIKRLVDITDPDQLEEHIRLVADMVSEYEATKAVHPNLNPTFPITITLGTVNYPMGVFSESIGYERIRKVFGTATDVNTGDDYDNADHEEAVLPLVCDLRRVFNLFLDCPQQTSGQMLEFTHQLVWRFLAALPASKINLCIFDSELRGNSVVPFLDFKKYVPEIFDQQIFTSPDEIHQRLAQLNRSIDEFLQDKLGNRYANMLEYNQHASKRSEPITLLIIYDFPHGFDTNSASLLLNILKNGSKCGVFTILCYNPKANISRYDSIEEKLDDIMGQCAIVDYRAGGYALMPYGLPIAIRNAMTATEADRFITEYKQACDSLRKEGISLQEVLPAELFSRRSAGELTVPIGIGDEDAIVNVTFGGSGSSHHMIIAGAIGSGKSTLLHTLIMSAMLNYSPDDLHLYLLDFKSGTEFKIYDSYRLPHLQLLAVDAMQEFGESILEELEREMTRRSDLVKNSGTTKLSDYVRETGKPMPRILVIMDEFQILFNDATNRKVAMHCATLANRIVTEGRAFGIHLVMATQTTRAFTDLTLARGTIEQMRVRIGLKCNEDDARYLFGDNNERSALEMMKGPLGTAVLNLDYTEESNIGLRTAYCDRASQVKYLNEIAEQFRDYRVRTQTFEGSRTEKLLDIFTTRGVARTELSPVTIHLGSLIKVAPPLALAIDGRRKHNLLVCGADTRVSENLTNSYMLSALMNTRSVVYCIDGEMLVGEAASATTYATLAHFGQQFRLAGNRADIIQFIHEAYARYTERRTKPSDDHVFLVIKNLQFLDIVRTMLSNEDVDESQFLPTAAEDNTLNDPTGLGFIDALTSGTGNDAPSVTAQLLRLIDDGPGFGITFVVSSTEYQIIRESMHYGSQTLPKFPERAVFSLNDTDADNLIDGVSVSHLRDNTVYFTDGINNNPEHVYQLKPYIMPSPEELAAFLDDLLGGRRD